MFQRISQRLGLLIAVALAGLLITGANSLLRLSNAGQVIHRFTHVAQPGMNALHTATRKLIELRGDTLDHIFNTDDDKLPLIELKIKADTSALLKAVQDYAPLIADDQDGKLLATDRQLIADYLQGLNKVLDLSRKNQNVAALEARAREFLPRDQAAQTALESHLIYKQQLASADAAASDRSYTGSVQLTLGILLATALLLAAVALATYRRVVGNTGAANREVARVSRDLDFSQPIPVRGKDEIAELLHAFNSLIARIRDSLSNMRDDAQRLASVSLELACSAEQVTASSSAQSDASQVMAAVVEQLTVSISEVSARTDEASALGHAAGELASNGKASVATTVTHIESIAGMLDEAAVELAGLKHSGEQIGAVLAVIKEVAEQTNLLALNAAIEAARAGEQGRGFAVVADEVRKLAERTAASTVDIARMVTAIQSSSSRVSLRMAHALVSVRAGVSSGQGSQQAVTQMAGRMSEKQVLVGEIASALHEQSQASAEIAGKVEHVAQMAAENSQAAQRSTVLSAELKQLASGMQLSVLAYRL